MQPVVSKLLLLMLAFADRYLFLFVPESDLVYEIWNGNVSVLQLEYVHLNK